MNEFLSRIIKLIDVKSLISLTVLLLFAILTLRGDVENDFFETVFMMVVSFYLGSRVGKSEARDDKKEDE